MCGVLFFLPLGFRKIQAVNEVVQKVKVQVAIKQVAAVVQGFAVVSND